MSQTSLGPNLGGSSRSKYSNERRNMVNVDTVKINANTPVVFSYTLQGGVVAGTTNSTGAMAGIAMRNANPGEAFAVAYTGPTWVKTSGAPAVGASLQLDATGAALTTKSTGASVGVLVNTPVANLALVDLRLT